MRKRHLISVRFVAICWVLALYSRLPGQASTEIVSVPYSDDEADGSSVYSAISADGNFVAFETAATNIVPDDTNDASDIILWDLDAWGATPVSVSTDGTPADGASTYPALSADGSRVVFESAATNLVENDTNGVADIFVRDVSLGTTIRVSTDGNGGEANGASSAPSISADGRYVVFLSKATNLRVGIEDANPGGDNVFLKDTVEGSVVLIDVTDFDLQPATGSASHAMISGDGRYVVFSTTSVLATDTNDLNDVYLRDWVAGTTTLVSHATGQERAANGSSEYPAIDHAGTRIAFESLATNLIATPLESLKRIYLHDVASDTSTVVSKNSQGELANRRSFTASISPDGRYVAFCSEAANLFPLDGNDKEDMFLHDTSTGKTILISMATDGSRGDGKSNSGYFILPQDAAAVAFRSESTNLVDGETTTAKRFHVYVRFRSEDTTPPEITCNENIEGFECNSPSGTIVEFTTTALDDLDPDPAVECDGPVDNEFPTGKTVVTCTATDNEGNDSSCSFEVTVADTQPPWIVPPDPISVYCTGPEGSIVEFNVSALDACDANVALTLVPPSGSLFPLGTTAVTATATDASGHTAITTFDVTVTKDVPMFLRGDSNSDSRVDIADPIFTLLYLFAGRRAPLCMDAADADDNGQVNMTDAIFYLQYLLLAGPVIPAPGINVLGIDPTEDALGCFEPKC